MSTTSTRGKAKRVADAQMQEPTERKRVCGSAPSLASSSASAPEPVVAPAPFSLLQRPATLKAAVTDFTPNIIGSSPGLINTGWLGAFTTATSFDTKSGPYFTAPYGWNALEADPRTGEIVTIIDTNTNFVTTPALYYNTCRLLAANVTIAIATEDGRVVVSQWNIENGILYLPMASRPIPPLTEEASAFAVAAVALLAKCLTSSPEKLRYFATTALALITTTSVTGLEDLRKIIVKSRKDIPAPLSTLAETMAGDNLKPAFAAATIAMLAGSLSTEQKYSIAAEWRPRLNPSSFRSFASHLELPLFLTNTAPGNIFIAPGSTSIPAYTRDKIPAGALVLINEGQSSTGDQVSRMLDNDRTEYLCLQSLTDVVFTRKVKSGAAIQTLGGPDKAKISAIPAATLCSLASAAPPAPASAVASAKQAVPTIALSSL